MNNDYTVVSAKNNAVLSRNKSNSMCYRVNFKVSRDDNGQIDPKHHITFNTYGDLLRLNSDILDDISLEDVPGEPNARYVLMQIKPVASSIGIKGKFIVSKVTLIHPGTKNCAGLVGASVPLKQTRTFSPNPYYEELICENTNLFAFWDESDSSMVVQYDFTLVDPAFQKHGLSVPRAVSDTCALIIKKLLLRMKEYKEVQVNTVTYQ